VGLRNRIAALALSEVHVLLVERPGWSLTRIAAERAVAARGWRVADSAAAADALLCCGEPGPELSPLVEAMFAQLPPPRARGRVDHPGEVAAVLDQILAALRADDPVPVPPRDRPARSVHAAQPAADHGDMDHAVDPAADHGDMGGGDQDDMGDMDMSGPGGIPLAGGDQDRDGLEMDVLPVRLGPVLPAWPAGLVLSVVLAGDLITDCHADTVDARAENPLPPQLSQREDAALAVDRIGPLLLLAGAGRAERRLRRVRDALLDGIEIPWCTALLRRLTDRLSRSRSLRWSLRGLGRIDQVALQETDCPLGWSGDVLDRLHRRLAGLSGLLAELSSPAVPGYRLEGPSMTRAGLDLVCDAVRGLDLGAARLVIASFDIDLSGSVGSTPAAATAGPGA